MMNSKKEKYIAQFVESVIVHMILDYMEIKDKPVSLDKIINHIKKYTEDIGVRLTKVGKVDARDYILQLLNDKIIKKDDENNFIFPDEEELLKEVLEHFEKIHDENELEFESVDDIEDYFENTYQSDLFFDDEDDDE